MRRRQHKATEIMKNEANVTPPKETNKATVTNPKEMEIYKLPDLELKIIKEVHQAIREHR